jgi:hypothetical protein
LKEQDIGNMGLLNAFGVAIRPRAFSTKNFDLAMKAADRHAHELPRFSDYKSTAKVMGMCLLIVFLSFYLTHRMTAGYKNRIDTLEAKQGQLKSFDTSQIETMRKEMEDKLAAYQNIRMKTNVHYYLEKLPRMLPEGGWLDSFNIQYYHATPTDAGRSRGKYANRLILRLSIMMSGYVYHQNVNEQFRLVNSFVSRLKEDEDFTKSFDTIDLGSINQAVVENFNVARFQINCK